MRNSGLREAKVYSTDSLRVVGDGVALRKPHAAKSIRIGQREQGPAEDKEPPKGRATNVTPFPDAQVASKQLKRIREVVRAEDFDRILRGLRPRGDRTLDGLGAVYDQFFGRHYAHLRDIARSAAV